MNFALLRNLRGYKLADLPHDAVAGVVVAALSIPVAMGYAQITGLPPIYGLYAMILPVAVYALTTGTKNVVFSMDSAASAATGGVVASAGIALGSGEAIGFMPVLTLTVSAFLLVFALLRVGRLVRHVPIPVMQGFVVGISLTVVLGQISLLAGSGSVPGSDAVSEVSAMVSGGFSPNPLSLVLGVSSLALLFAMSRYAPRLPTALLLIVLGTVITAGARLDMAGIAVLGAVDAGFPTLAFPDVLSVDLLAMVGYGFSIAVIVSLESLLTIDTFAMRDGARAHENEELVSLGIANISSAFCGCAPCSASLSRTAAGEEAGGRTQIVSLVAALTISLVIIFLAPLFAYLPQPILAAVVIKAMCDVVDYRKIGRYAKHMHVELAVFLVSVAVVVLFGVVVGVGAGIAFSLMALVYRVRRKSERGYLGIAPTEKGSTLLDRSDEVSLPRKDTVVFPVAGNLSFLNVGAIVDGFVDKVGPDIKLVILDLSAVVDIDTTATEQMLRFITMMHARSVQVRIVRSVTLSNDSYTRFELTHMVEKVKSYPSVRAALAGLPQDDEMLVKRAAPQEKGPSGPGSDVR